MATVYWKSGTPKVAQVNTWTFATAGSAGDVITVTIGQKSWTYTTTSGTIATFLPLFLTAINALDSSVYPEFAEITFTNPTSSTIVGTAKTAGKPFTCTLATNSAGTTINSGSSSTGTATTVSKGPEDVTTAANWSGGAVPSTGDTIIIDLEGARLKYGLNQSAITAAVRRILAKDVQIGLPKTNTDGVAYPEYRPDYWQMTATSDYVNTTSGRIKLDNGTGQTTLEVANSGNGVETNVPAVLIKGTHSSNEFNIFGGNVGFAYFAGESCTLNTLRIDAGATVTCGFGCTNNTLNNYGGTLTLYSAIVTALNHPGAAAAKTTIEGSGAVAQITSQGGTITYNSTGALGGNTILGINAVLTFDQDQRAKTVTNPIQVFSPNARVSDSFGVVSGGLTIQFKNCVGSLKLKPNAQVVITYL